MATAVAAVYPLLWICVPNDYFYRSDRYLGGIHSERAMDLVRAVCDRCLVPIAGPILRGRMTVSVAEWAYIAIHQSGLLRSYAESSLITGLMVLGLILALKSLFWPQPRPLESTHPRVRIACVAGLLTGIIICFFWVNFRQYEITPAQMNSWQMMRAPPPPDSEKN